MAGEKKQMQETFSALFVFTSNQDINSKDVLPSSLSQEGQKLITGDNSRTLSAQRLVADQSTLQTSLKLALIYHSCPHTVYFPFRNLPSLETQNPISLS